MSRNGIIEIADTTARVRKGSGFLYPQNIGELCADEIEKLTSKDRRSQIEAIERVFSANERFVVET